MGGPEALRIPGMDFREMRGVNWRSMLKYKELIPLYMVGVFAIGLSSSALLRAAFKNPDVSWTKDNEPWEQYRNKQVKFFSSGRDYSVPNPAPQYKED